MHANPTTRSQDEIVARIESRRHDDPLGFETGEYIDYLDFEHASGEYLIEGTTEEQWKEVVPDPPKQAMVSYMEFAFDKAHGERGTSACRSLSHMIAWAWLSGDEELSKYIEDAYSNEYHSYGLVILRGICQHLGIDPEQHGDG